MHEIWYSIHIASNLGVHTSATEVPQGTFATPDQGATVAIDSNPSPQDELDRLYRLAEICSSHKPPESTVWLSRVINAVESIACAARNECLQANLPKAPTADDPKSILVTEHQILVEGHEGGVGLTGDGAHLSTTEITTVRSFVTTDYEADPTLPHTQQLASDLTDLRRQANRRRIMLEKPGN